MASKFQEAARISIPIFVRLTSRGSTTSTASRNGVITFAILVDGLTTVIWLDGPGRHLSAHSPRSSDLPPKIILRFVQDIPLTCLCLYDTFDSKLFHLSHANDVDHAWASSRTKEELDQVVEPFVQAKRQAGQWTQEDEAGYQLYRQETDPEKRTFRVWYLIANPRGLPKEFVQKELEFRWKLFPEKKEETK